MTAAMKSRMTLAMKNPDPYCFQKVLPAGAYRLPTLPVNKADAGKFSVFISMAVLQELEEALLANSHLMRAVLEERGSYEFFFI